LAAETIREILEAIGAATDVVVIDLPRPDHEIFAALAPSVETMILLAGSGISELAGASAMAPRVLSARPDAWLCLRTDGRGTHFADTVALALDLPLLAVVREESSLAADVLHGIPPGSCTKGPMAAAADTVLAERVLCARDEAS
jgi:hypothetical protein